MRYNAEVITLDENIEEAVTIKIGESTITGFSSICPYPIHIGLIYPVSLELWSLEGLILREVKEPSSIPSLQRVGTGFQYVVFGKLEGRILDAGIEFEDDWFTQEYGYLSGHMVQTEADRIQIEFLTS